MATCEDYVATGEMAGKPDEPTKDEVIDTITQTTKSDLNPLKKSGFAVSKVHL